MTSHDGGHFVVQDSVRSHGKPCTRANVRDAQSDLYIYNDNKNDQYHLCMTIAIKMVYQYFHPSDLVIKSTYLIKKY